MNSNQWTTDNSLSKVMADLVRWNAGAPACGHRYISVLGFCLVMALRFDITFLIFMILLYVVRAFSPLVMSDDLLIQARRFRVFS